MELEKTLYRVHERLLSSNYTNRIMQFSLIIFLTISLYGLINFILLNLTREGKQQCINFHTDYTLQNETLYEIIISNNGDKPMLTMQLSSIRELITMDKQIREKHNYTLSQQTIPYSCYAENTLDKLLMFSTNLETIFLNDVVSTLKSNIYAKNNETNETWVWLEKSLAVYQNRDNEPILEKIVDIILTFFKIYLGLFIQSAVASIYIKMTIICAPVFIVLMIDCMSVFGNREIQPQVLARAFPWIGQYLNLLHRNMRSKGNLLAAFFLMLVLFYFVYLSSIFIGTDQMKISLDQWPQMNFYLCYSQERECHYISFLSLLHFITLLIYIMFNFHVMDSFIQDFRLYFSYHQLHLLFSYIYSKFQDQVGVLYLHIHQLLIDQDVIIYHYFKWDGLMIFHKFGLCFIHYMEEDFSKFKIWHLLIVIFHYLIMYYSKILKCRKCRISNNRKCELLQILQIQFYCLMEGYLKKWTNVFQRWQNRYFILNDDVLAYCDHQGSPIKGQIHLKVAAIMLVPEDPLRIILNTGTTEVHLRAATITDKINWVNALKQAQDKCLVKNNEIQFDQRIQELLTDVWMTSAAFDETLNILIPKLDKSNKEMAEKLEQLSKNLKIKITLCAQMVEEEKIKLGQYDYDNGTVYQSFGFGSQQRIIEDQQSIIQSQLSINEILSPVNQPIKYKNMVNNIVFQKLKFTNVSRREQLPFKKDPNESLNIFKLCKELIGRDLTRFAVPVVLNEPLSMLQRLAETMEYVDLLNNSNSIDDSALRMCYIMAFGLATYAGNIGRTKKPFNPILGETFELINSNFKFVSEQVSHHPPISAGYAESENFEFWAHTDVHTKFTGLQFIVNPLGHFNIVLKKHNDHFIFNRCTTKVQNIIWGEIFIDNVGTMNFKNLSNGDYGALELIEKNSKSQCEVIGYVKDRLNVERYKLKGHWNDKLIAYNDHKEIIVWKRHQVPDDWAWQYHFTDFALQLNHLTIDLIKTLPATDCRLRPDQLALEYGWTDVAADEKHRLEEKQRARRKEMEKTNTKHEPVYFEEQLSSQGEKSYRYKNNYFNRNIENEGMDLF